MILVWNAHLKHHPRYFHRFSPRSHCSLPKVSPRGGRQKGTKRELCKKCDVCGPCRSQEGTFESIFYQHRVERCMSGYMIHAYKHIHTRAICGYTHAHMRHVWIHARTHMCRMWSHACTHTWAMCGFMHAHI